MMKESKEKRTWVQYQGVAQQSMPAIVECRACRESLQEKLERKEYRKQ